MIADIMIADIMMLRIEGCTSSMISHDYPGKVHIKYDHEDFTYGCLVEGRGVATFVIHYIVSKNTTSSSQERKKQQTNLRIVSSSRYGVTIAVTSP